MKRITKALQRPLYAVAALAMLIGIAATAVVPGLVSAGELTDRSIKMSTAVPGATATYNISFTADSGATSIRSVVVDFCDASPLYEDVCGHTNGLNASSATLSAQSGTSGWTITPAAQQLIISGASQNSGATISFTVAGITNPSPHTQFYARIASYASQAPATDGYVSATNVGTNIDFGGIALTTTQYTVDITARVQEKLQFCVSKLNPGTNCGASGQAVTDPELTLGTGSPTKVIDEQQVYDDNAFIQVSTNAQSGVVIRMKNSNACGGLDRGNNLCEIPAAGSGASTAGGFTISGAGFGLYCTPGSANLTAEAPYDGGTTNYGMDTETGVTPDSVTSTYGSPILSSAGAINNESAELVYGARASLTTPAGIYTASMDLIATGTF